MMMMSTEKQFEAKIYIYIYIEDGGETTHTRATHYLFFFVPNVNTLSFVPVYFPALGGNGGGGGRIALLGCRRGDRGGE